MAATTEDAPKDIVKILSETDDLYELCRYDEIYDLLLPYKDIENAEVLWRLARACYRRGKPIEDATAKTAVLKEGLRYAEQALALDKDNFAVHKWMAIMVNDVANLEGNKARILQSFVMKEHMERACELNPTDGTCWYLLGMWHFNIQGISWYQRKIASVLFASPPESTLDQALETFLHAEKVAPNFYGMNLLMIARCFMQKGDKVQAKQYFERARDYTKENLSEDDREAIEEGKKALEFL